MTTTVDAGFQILSAQYVNAQRTAVNAVTRDYGSVIITPGRPELWAFFQEWVASGNVVSPMSIQPLKATLRAKIAARYAAALEAGMPYGGKVLQIREADQLNITTMGNEARWAKGVGAGWPPDFAWRMADNTFLALPTPNDCIAMALAAKAEVIRLRKNKWRLDDLVASAGSAETVAAINIETGW
jgi:hypothetical protein